MSHKYEIIKSWLNVHTENAIVFDCDDLIELQKLVDGFPKARAVGKSHSYNRSALHKKIIRLGPSFDYVDKLDGNRFVIGAATSIEDVMLKLREYGLRLPNSGNHRQQTFVGACIGGTHGFGENATMMDCVKTIRSIETVVYEVEIEAVPLTVYEVTHCVCPLSDLKEQSETSARSYAVMPYSGKDPLCIISEYRDMPDITDEERDEFGWLNNEEMADRENPRWETEKKTWWRIRVIQWLQKTFPLFQRCGQKLLNFAKMRKWKEITDINDIDALYHPWPEADRGPIKNSKWLYWSQRPTYQYYNICLAAKPEQTQEIIKRIIELGNNKLSGFLGVRELKDKSNYEKALNFDGPRNAIDIYVYPKHADIAHKVQKQIEKEFEVRLHPSKSI